MDNPWNIVPLSSCADKKLENERLILNELRGLESNTNSNVTYAQYSNRLVSITAEVGAAIKENTDLAFSARVNEIENRYRAALAAWDESIHGNPDQKDNVVRYWKGASEKLSRLEKYVNSAAPGRKAIDAEDERIANDQRRAESARAALEQRRREAAEAQEARDQIAAAKAERERRYAPAGTLFVLQSLTVRIKGGLAGISPGAEVAVLRKNLDGTLHVRQKSDLLEFDLRPALTTNDRDLAANLGQADDAEQQRAAAALD